MSHPPISRLVEAGPPGGDVRAASQHVVHRAYLLVGPPQVLADQGRTATPVGRCRLRMSMPARGLASARALRRLCTLLTATPSLATLNQRREQLWEGNAARLQSLADKAMDTIEDVMDDGETDTVRLRAALAVLKGQGLADVAKPWGETDPG